MLEQVPIEDLIKLTLEELNDAEGEMENGLIPFNVKRFNQFSLAYHSDYREHAGLWGFINKNGEVVCEPQFLFMPFCFGENYIVCKGTGWEYYEGLPKEGLWSKEMHWGLINKNFETIIPFEFDEIEWLGQESGANYFERKLNEKDYFVCRKYIDDENKFYKESEVRDSTNKIIFSGYNDVGYGIDNYQITVFKDRDRFGDGSEGYTGIYDFKLNKEIISPNKYHHIEIVDYNLFDITEDEENYYYGTLINEKEEIIGEEKIWNAVDVTFRNKRKYKYKGKTMDEKHYVFNIKENIIVDLLEISRDEYFKKY